MAESMDDNTKNQHQERNIWKRLIEMRSEDVSPQVYDTYRSEINALNLQSLQRTIFSMSIIFLLVVVLELIFTRTSFFDESIFLLGVFGGSIPLFLSTKSDLKAHGTMAAYVWCAILLCLAAFFEAAFHPDETGFLFMVLLIVVVTGIMDKPRNIFIYDMILSGLYVLLKVSLADETIFFEDILRLIIIDFIALSSNFRIMNNRVVLMQKNETSQNSAEHDALTGIMNRRGGDAMIRAYMANGVTGTFILMDVDLFKHINDTYGHGRGDEVLKQVAHNLSQAFRNGDVVMRMGGDEFIVYATGIEDIHSVEKRLQLIKERMHTIVLDEETGDHVSVSIGCCINHGSYPSYEAMYAVADRMLYYVKEHGKDGYKITEADFQIPKKRPGTPVEPEKKEA